VFVTDGVKLMSLGVESGDAARVTQDIPAYWGRCRAVTAGVTRLSAATALDYTA